MTGEILSLVMFAVACGVLILGFPVAFSLAGTGLAFALLGDALGVFDMPLLGSLPSRYFGVMSNELYVAIPLFVFMGVMLERARIAEKLLTTMGMLFGTMRGGLGISVVIVGMLLAASTGIVGATVVTMGLLSLPAMQKAGYDPKLSTGVICASGTLGQIIPPSIVLVLLGDILQGSYAEAQRALGNWAPEPISVMDLFAGAFIPGMLLVGMYIGWIIIKSIIDPNSAPALVEGKRPEGLWGEVLRALLPPALLIVAVLGSILTGIATPTESAAFGSVGATVLAAAYRRLDMAVLRHVIRQTLQVTAMVFVILLGASVFSLVFRGLGGDKLVEDLLHNLPGGAFGAMLVVMLLMFFMGFFLDFIEIVFVVVPIVGPILLKLDIDPVWLGIMIAINLQTSFLTPPFGFALFYLRGVAPPSIQTMDIYRGIIPFVIIQMLGLCLVAGFPWLATWLPSVLF
ncbi:TRAP transporter large permease [Thalassospira lucentensis]|uniref:TRAP transporter large permease n=1 Tax=Thalassospira lucentensis TaxID=168935 RepID=UPI00142D8CA4|nr:TRAP transporter large permease subunit [Thalassospira lucentensis]NIZ02189.1 TRAP transporter large permease subunit [Thalassospira lucentensis]